MKKIILPGFFTMCLAIGSAAVFAQKEQVEKKETREIIIRKNGNIEKKMKIEIDGDKVTVNGKPLSDYNDDDVTVIERDLHNGPDVLFAPGDRGSSLNFFKNDMNEYDGPSTFLGVITEKANNGVKVKEVMKATGAEKAGLQNGDVITKVDEKSLSTPDDLVDAIKAHKPGDEVKVYYDRNGKKNNMKVKLGERKQRVKTFSFNNNNDFNKGGNNFRMPPMLKMQNGPQNFFRYFRSDNVKLGVKVEDAQDNGGAKILSVEEGSAAEKAGLKKDDIITELDGDNVENVDEVRSQLMGAVDKESFILKAKRNNTEMNFEVKIPKPVNSADL